MADIICRWRNGSSKTVVELANSLPHKVMNIKDFREYMADKWDGNFFTTPYQLACQLGLYCEAENGLYYPRFDHDITEEEANTYLLHWFPRYYIPNPYVRKDGFNTIKCPTFVLKSIYDYVKENPSANYATAYKTVFKEESKNNDDIMRNYINNFSKVLHMNKHGKLEVTDYNPHKIFGFMDRHNKKEFFDNFNLENKSLRDYYTQSDTDRRKEIFYIYLKKIKKLSINTIKQYTSYHLNEPNVLNVIKEMTGKENLYEVIVLSEIQMIWNGCNKLEVNKNRNNVYTASISNYKEFIDFLDSEEADSLLNDEQGDKSEPLATIVTPSTNKEPFSISKLINYINETGLLYDATLIKRFAFSLMAKRFLILSGLAGSGKTQLAIAFAKALAESDDQVQIVSVGADWTNREPLLGFPNALKEGHYEKPESKALDLLIKANKEENSNKPFFLILDEMNMSYVERYFADFLSSMESDEPISLWENSEDNEVPAKISLPKNLFIIGTINVDETTYMFSPKVLDRANVIEFKISEKEMNKFLTEMKPVNRNSINFKAASMGQSFVELAACKEIADNNENIKKTLESFFTNLKAVNAEFGYRSATEIFRFIRQALQNDEDFEEEKRLTIEQILDCAIVQKLLPKLHGSRKKLEPVLQALWKECFDGAEIKETMSISKENIHKAKYKLTADKIQRMYEAAYANGFTSFAEA